MATERGSVAVMLAVQRIRCRYGGRTRRAAL